MKRPSGSRRVRKSAPIGPETAPKPSAKNQIEWEWIPFWGPFLAKTGAVLSASPVQECSGCVGINSSRTCVGINVRRAWRTIARGAAKPWEPSGTAVCETSVAYLRKQSKLALFFDRRQKICRQTAPVLGSRNGPQNGGQVVRTQANQIETE